MPWQPLPHMTHHQTWDFECVLSVNICLCVSPSSSPQHCLSRTSPCMWQCLYPTPMPCISQEGLWAARPWQQLQPPWVTAGCCPLRRPRCIGMWAPVEVLRGPPVQEVQVSWKSGRFNLVYYRHFVKIWFCFPICIDCDKNTAYRQGIVTVCNPRKIFGSVVKWISIFALRYSNHFLAWA